MALKVHTSIYFCLYNGKYKRLDIEGDPRVPRVLRHIELIDDEAAEYGIKVVKCSDRLMAKKHGFRSPPGITYFRKSKYINYDGQYSRVYEILIIL